MIVSNESGIYVVRILSSEYMPVTRDKRYIDVCAKVNKNNVKIGKAKNLSNRQKDYWKDFDKENVIFQPIALLENIQQAETIILRHLKEYRLRSPKNSPMDWLHNISIESAIKEAHFALKQKSIKYIIINP